MAPIIFWILLILAAIGAGTADRWKGGPFVSFGLILVLLALLGLKVFGFSL